MRVTHWSHQLLDDLDVPVSINMTVPNAARMYDYYLGGVNYFPADRDAAEHVLRVAPWIRATALENRAFLGRAVEYLAGQAGIRQFVDIGTGLPTAGNVHEVAHRIAPDARVAYVDNDPVVLGQSRALLSKVENTVTIRADLRQPQGIIDHPDLAGFIDWAQPVALLLVAVVHFIQDHENPQAIIGQYRNAMAPRKPPRRVTRPPPARQRSRPPGGDRLRQSERTAGLPHARADSRTVHRLRTSQPWCRPVARLASGAAPVSSRRGMGPSRCRPFGGLTCCG